MSFVHFFNDCIELEGRPIPMAESISYLSEFGDTPQIGVEQIVTLPSAMEVAGRVWTHAVQIDGGTQRLLRDTPPGRPYQRVTQAAHCFAYENGKARPAQLEEIFALVERGGFMFWRGHTYMLCASFDDAKAWIEAHSGMWREFGRAIAAAVKGVNGKRLPMILLAPGSAPEPAYGAVESEEIVDSIVTPPIQRPR